MKICSKCNVEKEDGEFRPKRRQCLECYAKIRKDNYWEDPERHKARCRESQKKHKEKRREYAKKYIKDNKEKLDSYNKIYLVKNKELIKARRIERSLNQKKTCKICDVEKTKRDFESKSPICNECQKPGFKFCIKCKVSGDSYLFSENRNTCDKCRRAQAKSRPSYIAFSAKKKEYSKKYHEENKEHLNLYAKEYHIKNKERLNQEAREYRVVNLPRIKEVRKENQRRNQIMVNDIKRKAPCSDCGNNFEPYLMDFDHLQDKEHDVSRMISQDYYKEQILKEIAKCEIVCANCHIVRTYARKSKTIYSLKYLACFVDDIKNQPCMDCGCIFPPEAMDFDHRNPKEKEFNIAKYRDAPIKHLDKLKEEIAKCDVVCRVCHRKRTMKMFHLHVIKQELEYQSLNS